MSRTVARDEVSEEMLLEALGDVRLLGASRKQRRNEALQAYKNLQNVIDVLNETIITVPVTHLQTLVVIKGN